MDMLLVNERRAQRRTVFVDCQVVREEGFQLVGQRALDLSPRGLFLRTDMKAQPGEELRILYLTTQEIDHTLPTSGRRAVFAALLEALYADPRVADYHMVAMTDYDRESMLDVIEPAFFTQKTPTLLYAMTTPGTHEPVNEAHLRVHAGHEMCLT